MKTFAITPQGPFSLQEAAGFGFGSKDRQKFDGVMKMAFVIDGYREQAGVLLRQEDDGTVMGEVEGTRSVEAVSQQVARILSLDHNGEEWLEVGQRDPVIGKLQRDYPGLRPVLFNSPYEGALWSVVSARRHRAQARRLLQKLSKQHGKVFELDGQELSAAPLPEAMLQVTSFPGLNAERMQRLHAIAQAALDGRLDPGKIKKSNPDTAIAEIRRLPGMGPFYASLIVIRSSGVRDVLPLNEPRTLEYIKYFYGLPKTPDLETYLQIAEKWEPYRTWAVVLLRIAGDRLKLPVTHPRRKR